MNMQQRLLNRAAIFFTIAITVFFIIGCADSVSGTPKEQTAAVRLIINMEQPRTILPDMSIQTDITSWKLNGTYIASQTQSCIKTWNSADEIQNEVIELQQGTWDFSLSAYKDETVVLTGQANSINVTSGVTPVHIKLNPISEGNGFIDVDFTVPENVSELTAELKQFAADGTIHETDTGTQTLAVNNNTAVYSSGPLPAGNYLLTVSGSGIALYSEAVTVAANSTSRKSIELGRPPADIVTIDEAASYIQSLKPSDTPYPLIITGVDDENISELKSILSNNINNNRQVRLALDLSRNTGLTKLIDPCFRKSAYLYSIILPDSVQELGNSVFEHCENITKITLPANLTKLGNGVFIGCRNLSVFITGNNPHFTAQNGMLLSEDRTILYAFPSAKGFVELPQTITHIFHSAFKECPDLSGILLPEQLIQIDQAAFYGCKNLTSISIPGQVNIIEKSAFGSCTELKSVNISESVTEIRESAFLDCNNINTIICNGVKPPFLWKEAVTDIPKTATVYVPDTAIETYDQSQWSDFIIKPISQLPQRQ